ncbi:hypothetical protein [Thauera sp. GDN1]|uniref:hypothetical protein n=1 Tax=Thauera sp. GDN1 TaxID=2944810 RepID=UPI002478DA7B|nr:hypothetical protein [Thauera sp. GDN1]
MVAVSRESQFEGLLKDAPDLLSLVVKAHYSIDQLLNIALLEALPKADAIEIERVAFLLKVDFATGLGILRRDLRPVFNLINTIRNRFAHNPYTEFSVKDGLDAKNVLLSRSAPVVPDEFKDEQEPREVLETLFAVGFVNIVVAHERLCIRKAESHVANQMAVETLSGARASERRELSTQERFERRLKLYLEERHPEIKHG